MPDNQIIFPVGPTLSGLAAELRVRLLLPTGDVDAQATPIAVTESATVPGLYRATMAGAAGRYGAVLLRVVSASEVFVASVGNFRWDGTDFVTGEFLAGDRTLLSAARDRVLTLAKRQGLEPGISATVKDAALGRPGSLVTSDDAIAQTLTVNPDGSVTIANAAN